MLKYVYTVKILFSWEQNIVISSETGFLQTNPVSEEPNQRILLYVIQLHQK